MTGEEALNLGVMYFNGQLVERNYKKAYDLFKQAEALDNQEVYRWLGIYFSPFNESLTFLDSSDFCFKQAFFYLRKAIEFNPQDAKALFLYGRCYFKSFSAEQDKQKFFELISQAAELGYQEAFNDLRYCFSVGYGVERDLNKALYWAKKYGDEFWIKNIRRDIREQESRNKKNQ